MAWLLIKKFFKSKTNAKTIVTLILVACKYRLNFNYTLIFLANVFSVHYSKSSKKFEILFYIEISNYITLDVKIWHSVIACLISNLTNC